MKNLLILLFVFLSFNSFSQSFKTDPARKSLLSNQYVRNAESNILSFIYDWDHNLKTDTTVNFREIRENALEAAKNDTLLLFSSGGMGYNSNAGAGMYDSITLGYSFLYEDIYTDCVVTQDFEKGTEIYNSIIKDEIAKRYSKNWETEIKEAKNKENIRIGRKIDLRLLIDDIVIDTIYIERVENLKVYIPNKKIVNEIGKREFVSTISFAKGRKLVSQYENVKSENIESILKNEFKIKSIDEIDRIVIEFSNIYYSLGLYVYPIK